MRKQQTIKNHRTDQSRTQVELDLRRVSKPIWGPLKLVSNVMWMVNKKTKYFHFKKYTQSGKTSACYSPMNVLNNQNNEFIF